MDAGHGGTDSGAIRSGVKEKDLNLAIAARLARVLKARGATVVMTRSGDHTVNREGRVNVTNTVCPDAFLSVHSNASRQKSSSLNGVEVYYYTPQSRALAVLVRDALVSEVKAADRGVRWSELYVIHHTDVPAVLVEAGYLSHSRERSLLATEDYQQQIAEAIANGVECYFSAKEPDGVQSQ